VPPVEVTALSRAAPGETSAKVRERVIAARRIQSARQRERGLSAKLNAALPTSEVESVAQLDDRSRELIERAVSRLGLSARAWSKVLRVARTIADLENELHVRSSHVAEAIQGRLLDRQSSW